VAILLFTCALLVSPLLEYNPLGDLSCLVSSVLYKYQKREQVNVKERSSSN
jgi:hypothetical protein